MRAKPYGLAEEFALVSCEAHHLPMQPKGKRGIGGCKEEGPNGPFSFACTKLARLGPYRNEPSMKLSVEQERERLKRWMASGEVYDPRNEPDYDTFEYATEPLPGDTTWAKKKPLKGL